MKRDEDERMGKKMKVEEIESPYSGMLGCL